MGNIDLPQIFTLIAALSFVIALMFMLALVMKKLGFDQMQRRGKNARLRVVESLPLDARRRAVLLQRDDVQHLVIVGHAGETVVETGIKPVQGGGDEE